MASVKKYVTAGLAIFFVVFILIIYLSIRKNTLAHRSDQQIANLPWENIRLSSSIKPKHYDLWLYPDLRNGSFTGRVTISVDVLDSQQKHVAVHVKGLTFKTAKLMSDNNGQGMEISLKQSFEYKKNEFWILVPEKIMEAGSYKLFFEFEGQLLNKIVGFYRSAYKDVDGKERFIATSKFEPTFARQAFPCFDEPGIKAEFDIQLVKPSENEYIALSNMDQLEEIRHTPSTGLSTVKFSSTKPMSTYLACFIVCDFDHLKSGITDGKFPVTVYARKGQIENAHLAQHVALNATNFYLSYFNVPYPLPKLDLIAVPDFVSGAMENWGLITFRETRLLCDLANSAISSQLDVALTVAHEIAHMWFGDLVTMSWWNDLWLNEGFATFIEYKAVDSIYPDRDLDGLFLLSELFPVLSPDATLSSHPIIMPVKNPDQITEIFDSISYNKGASVIRMLEYTIGPKAFSSGIHNYLKQFSFKNAETEDLWCYLSETANDIDVKSFMETWTLQMGYPVINVKVHRDKKTLEFSQKRFLLNSEASYENNSSPFGYSWEVPITYVSSLNSETVKTSWIKKTEQKIFVPYEEYLQTDGSQLTWIKVNFRHRGYYIVNYEMPLWKNLQNLLKKNPQTLHPADRASLIFDAFILAEAEQLPYEYALDLVDSMKKEDNYVPWVVASKQIHSLLQKLYGVDGYELLRSYIRNLTHDMSISWIINDETSYLEKSLQVTLLGLSCLAGNTDCLNQAAAFFKQWLSKPSEKLHPELENIILKYGVEQTSEIEWNQLWNMYLNEQNPQKKVNIMSALCSSKNASTIYNYLQMGKNESNVRSQDYLSVIIRASKNPTVNSVVWGFVRNEWDYLVSRYSLNDRYLGRVIPEVTSSFSTEKKLSEMREFFNKYPEAGAGERARKLAVEKVMNNIKWRNRNLVPVTEWLKNKTLP